MKNEKNNPGMTGEHTERFLQHLMHLKRYERPETARETKNKHNIMRRVREAQHNKRRSLTELIEVSIPWFFAEPRYGMALLFIVFAGLQYWGVSSQRQASGRMGFYTSDADIAAYEQTSSIATNRIVYPKVPEGFQLLPDPIGDGDVKFVGRREAAK